MKSKLSKAGLLQELRQKKLYASESPASAIGNA
jgi:ribosomal protein S21